ncbi:unnamed protein product, partial [Amoebophrya sp. A25]
GTRLHKNQARATTSSQHHARSQNAVGAARGCSRSAPTSNLATALTDPATSFFKEVEKDKKW